MKYNYNRGDNFTANIVSYNPATLEIVGEEKTTEVIDIMDIVDRSRKVQKDWAKYSIKRRRSLLKKLMKYMMKNIDEIAEIICLETGKPKLEAINNDIIAALGFIKHSIGALPTVLKMNKIKLKGMRLVMTFLGRKSYLLKRPVGVVGIISPWNFPFGIPFGQVVQAVAVGNSVILKPSSETIFTGLKIQSLFEKVGFPKDLVQVIIGSGSTVGNELVKSPIDKIIFTGSVDVGKSVMRMAAQRLTPVVLELGGKSPMIVLKDAVLDRTVKGAMWGSFLNLGQVCSGVKRIYVQEEIFDVFLNVFKEEVENLKQGWGWDNPDISIGPLINEKALFEMQRVVQRAIEQGGQIITGGKRNENLKGNFFLPTIITNVKNDFDCVQEEIFGPVVVVLPFKTEEEAIKLANDNKFGLYGSVWTSNIKNGKRIARALKMGTVAINNHTYTFGIPHTPWGGNGNSGFGRTHGDLGLDEFLEPLHIHVDSERVNQDLWWLPYDEDKLKGQKEMAKLLFSRDYSKAFSLLKKMK